MTSDYTRIPWTVVTDGETVVSTCARCGERLVGPEPQRPRRDEHLGLHADADALQGRLEARIADIGGAV